MTCLQTFLWNGLILDVVYKISIDAIQPPACWHARNIYLVMELCSGGELFDRIIDAGSFTEAGPKQFTQLYIHTLVFRCSDIYVYLWYTYNRLKMSFLFHIAVLQMEVLRFHVNLDINSSFASPLWAVEAVCQVVAAILMQQIIRAVYYMHQNNAMTTGCFCWSEVWSSKAQLKLQQHP